MQGRKPLPTPLVQQAEMWASESRRDGSDSGSGAEESLAQG